MSAPKTSAPKQPQDHRKPAKKIADEAKPDFEFTHDDATFRLPHAQQYVAATSGGQFMDALLDGEAGETRLAMLALKAAQPDIEQDAFNALRAKGIEQFLETVNDWITHAQGADLGESEG